METIPSIETCIFRVSTKWKGKRSYWCESEYYPPGMTKARGYSGTSIELAYKDFRKQWRRWKAKI